MHALDLLFALAFLSVVYIASGIVLFVMRAAVLAANGGTRG